MRAFDIADPAECAGFIGVVVQSMGRIDHIVICPGKDVRILHSIMSTPEYVLQLNRSLKSVLNMAQTVFRTHLVVPGASFVNVLAAFNQTPASQLYRTAIIGISDLILGSVGQPPLSIRTNIVLPGVKGPVKEIFAEPADVADTVCSLMEGAMRAKNVNMVDVRAFA